MTQRKSGISARQRVGAAILAGVIVGLIVAILGAAPFAPLVGWDVAAVIFSTWIWLTISRMTAEQTSTFASREDPGRASADIVIIVASLVSLVAVGLVLASASGAHEPEKALLAGLAIVSVVLSWLTVHTLFTLHYAQLYYTGPDGGVDFNQSAPPDYLDFAYLAFTIGMTFQVSDTAFKNSQFRRAATRHALLSYLFGTVIVATTINLVAGLSK